MMFDFFSILIALLVLLILVLIIKTYLSTEFLKKSGIEKQDSIQKTIEKETKQFGVSYDKLKLMDGFNYSIVDKLFLIINELISLHKQTYSK